MRLLVAALVLLAACGGGSQSVEGRIIEFEGNLTSVRSFTIATADGGSVVLSVAPDTTFHGGPITHLRDHLISGQPVVVFYDEVNGDLVATSVEDA